MVYFKTNNMYNVHILYKCTLTVKYDAIESTWKRRGTCKVPGKCGVPGKYLESVRYLKSTWKVRGTWKVPGKC